MVPNCGLSMASNSTRRGRLMIVPTLSGSVVSIQTLKDHSFCTEGPRLFNALPRVIRDFTGTKEAFKRSLDVFLRQLPDQPPGPGGDIPMAMDEHGRPSNSIRSWVRALSLQDWVPRYHLIGEGQTRSLQD